MTPTRLDNTRSIRAPRRKTLTAKSWQTEAALRMLMNNFDAEVAERPQVWRRARRAGPNGHTKSILAIAVPGPYSPHGKPR